MQFGVVGATEEIAHCTVIAQLAHAFEVSTFLFFVTPMTLISILYALIGFRLRRSAVMKRSTSSQDSQYSVASTHGAYCKQTRSSQRVLKMLGELLNYELLLDPQPTDHHPCPKAMKIYLCLILSF